MPAFPPAFGSDDTVRLYGSLRYQVLPTIVVAVVVPTIDRCNLVRRPGAADHTPGAIAIRAPLQGSALYD
ncbi:MAG: hypothetical protein ACR2KM_02265 [Gemmatimonadaceae bacterium]